MQTDLVEDQRARRLILAASNVLRAIDPGDADWELRAHELARLLESAAAADPDCPLTRLMAQQRQVNRHVLGH
jgi:hypothetical protein